MASNELTCEQVQRLWIKMMRRFFIELGPSEPEDFAIGVHQGSCSKSPMCRYQMLEYFRAARFGYTIEVMEETLERISKYIDASAVKRTN